MYSKRGKSSKQIKRCPSLGLEEHEERTKWGRLGLSRRPSRSRIVLAETPRGVGSRLGRERSISQTDKKEVYKGPGNKADLSGVGMRRDGIQILS